MSNKTLEQSIRLVMEQQANAGVLYYGSDLARDTYAKDTPGQTPGVDHDPIQHQHKPNLALDGVPVPGGTLKKPNFEKDAGMGKVVKEDEDKEGKVKCEHCNGTGKHEGEDCTECKGTGFLKEMRGMGDSSMTGMDPNDATKQSELDKDKKLRDKLQKHDMKKGRDITKTNYSSVEQRKRAQKKFGESVEEGAFKDIATNKAETERLKKRMQDKKQTHQSYQKGGKNDPRGMGAVLAMGEGKGMKNCGCGKDPCETYGKGGKEEMKEAGRWDQTSAGRAYRRLSPEEKARRAKAKMIQRRSQAMKGNNKTGKVGITKLRSVYKGRKRAVEEFINDLHMAYVEEAMSPEERKRAAQKIFQMNQDKKANQALQQKSSPAAKAAKRDAASYKTSDDSHLDKKPSKPEKKRGRGERDLPHIVSQMRSVVDNDKHPGVKFKDGKTKKVSQKQASAYLKKHDSAKPADKLNMYKAHDSHKSFMKHVGEAVDEKDKKGLEKLVKGLKGSSAAHMDQMKKLKKMISDGYIAEKSVPNNPKLWAAKKAAAKAKFDVYPSAYANGWAAKAYKKAGGTWRSESVEHDLNELSTRTLTNYIQKASNPGDGRSAINQASRGGYKLGKQPPGGDLSAGEKNDRKAFKRGKGIMRAAQKIQRKTYGNMTKPTPYGGSEMSPSLTRKTKKEEKMPGQEYRIQMKKVKSKNPAVRKAVSNIYDKKGDIKMNHPDVKAAKKYMGMGEETVNEISAELINKVRQKRSANVVRAYNKYDDYRSPEYKDAVKKADRNQKLTFRAGAKKADQMAKALQKSVSKTIQKRKELQAKREQQKNT